MSRVAIGPLTVSFSEDPLCRNILSTMYGELPTSPAPVDVKIEGKNWRENEIPEHQPIRASDEVSISNGTHSIDNRNSYSSLKQLVVSRIGELGYYLIIDGWENDTLSIDIYYDGKIFDNELGCIRKYLKYTDRGFAKYQNNLPKTLVYNVFEPLWELKMVAQGASFLHAASVSIDGRGIALTGWGGTGKTSASSTLIRNSDNVTFLSDDLSIINKDGLMYPYPKSSIIYPYNTQGPYSVSVSEFIDRYPDRLQWEFRKLRHGKKGVRRRVPPEKLFANNVEISEPTPMECAIFLVREERSDFRHKSITTEELASRSTAVIMDELDWMIKYSASVRSAGGDEVCPQNILRVITSVYTDCFRSVDKVSVRIPMDSDPHELTNYLNNNILDEL